MSNNLGNLLVGFGLDLSALQKDAPEAFRILNQQTLGMTAEMKRASREGAESFRLIDEALGIHVSRPLTRILTQQFPALATTLQSLLGVGIVGALGAVAFEGFEKVSRAIEHARKAEEELESANRKSGQTFTDTMQSYEKAAKLRSLTGIDKKIFEIDSSSIDEGRKHIDELAASFEKVAAASAEAHKWTTELLAGIGDAAHVIFNSRASLGVEEIGKQFTEFQRRFDELSKLDALHGTSESAKLVADEIEKAQKSLTAMTALKLTGLQQFEGAVGTFFPQTGLHPQIGFSQAEIDRQKQFLDNLKQIQQVLGASAGDRAGREDEALKAEYAEEQLKAQKAIAELYKEMGSSLAKLQPETDPIKKLDAEISGFRSKAEEDFRAIGASAASALATSAALAGLESYEKKLDQLKIKLEGDIVAKQAFELLSEKFPGGGTVFGKPPVGTAGAPNFSATPAVPTLGGGGTAAAQFDVFSNDQAAQLKAAAAAYSDMLTPLDKYQLAQKELNVLVEKGLIDWGAYTAALQKASEQLVQGDDHLHKMEEDLQKLLERSESATAGIQAFFLQLQVQASENGRTAFALLNDGLKGFEDELTKVVFTGKAKWEDMFRSLSESAFKFFLQKDIANFFQLISGTGAGKALGLPGLLTPSAPQGPAPALPPTAPGSLTGLGALAGQGGAAGAAGDAAFQAGATLFQTATTAFAPSAPVFAAAATAFSTGAPILATAATELLAAATKMALGGIGGGGADVGDLADIPGFASGTDDAPGGLAWVGEQGPELLNLPGGSSVTPSASLRGSGGDSHYYDMRGAVVTEDLMRKSEAARWAMQTKHQAVTEAMAAVRETAERTLRSR